VFKGKIDGIEWSGELFASQWWKSTNDLINSRIQRLTLGYGLESLVA